MSTEQTGTDPNVAADAAAAAAATAAAATADTQAKGDGAAKVADGSTTNTGADWIAELDTDTRDWLQKRELKDAASVAKTAREQAKLLGNAIRIPGKDATDEEKAEYLTKLGRPEKPEGYEFAMPKDLPEDLPYDGERAAAFKAKAHEAGLTAAQAASLHDWFVGEGVNDFKNGATQRLEEIKTTAKAQTDLLVKEWGPLDGQTAQANLEFADRFVMNAAGPDGWAELERLGAVQTVGTTKVVTSAVLAKMFANAGMALYKEDGLAHGKGADVLGNPFAEGANFNATKQMQAYKNDPEHAKSLIAAAGKKPSDFGLKD